MYWLQQNYHQNLTHSQELQFQVIIIENQIDKYQSTLTMDLIPYESFEDLIEQYMRQILDEIHDSDALANAAGINDDLVEQLTRAIQEDQLQVSQIKKPYTIADKNQSKDPVKFAQEAIRKLQQIKGKKQIMERQLLKIQEEEQRIKQNHPVKEKSNSNHLRSYKSEISSVDIEKLRFLRVAHKKFQRNLEEKTKAYEQKLRKFKQEERQLQQKVRIQKCQERKIEIQKHLQLITKRQQERQKNLLKNNQSIQEIMKKKKMFEEMTKKWQIMEEEQEKRRQELMEQRKKMQNLDYDSLKEHKKKYYDLINKQKQQREKRMLEMQKVFGNNANENALFQSRLLNVVIDEEQKDKAHREQKKRFRKIQTQKKLEYAENVRVNYKPKQKKPQQPVIDSIKQEASDHRSLSLLETYQKGNDYMKAAHKNVSLVKVSNTVFSEDKTPFKYKDYLKEMGRTTKSGQYSQDTIEIKKLLKDQNVSQLEKLQRAKFIANRMDSKKGDINNLAENIRVKIDIIREIKE